MDIRSLFKQTVSHTKSLFTFHTRKLSFAHKLARYNFFNKRIQIKHLLNVAQINFVAGAKKVSSGIVALVNQACSGSAVMVKQTSTWIGGIFSKVYSGIKKAVFQTGLVTKSMWSKLGGFKNQYSFFIIFSGAVIIFGFGALLYFKNPSIDRLEDIPAIKALELRLTQTEAQLRDAQHQLQLMGNLGQEVKSTALRLEQTEGGLKDAHEVIGNLEHKVKRTASKLAETEGLLTERLAKTESGLNDAHRVMGSLEHEVKHNALKLEETESSLVERLGQTEVNLKNAHQVIDNLEHDVRRTASNLEKTEAFLKKRLVDAENKVEKIDSIGESLKLTGLVSLISKNKQKSLDKIKKLNAQNNERSNDLDRLKEKIRREVKRQMEVLD